MKNITLLHRSLYILNILFIVALIIQIFILVVPDLVYSKEYTEKVFGMFNHLIIVFRGILLLLGLYNAQQGLKSIIGDGFYNATAEVKFKNSGKFLILFGIISCFFNVFIYNELALNIFITNFLQYIFVLLVGLGLFVLSDFIKKGGILKYENDLTI